MGVTRQIWFRRHPTCPHPHHGIQHHTSIPYTPRTRCIKYIKMTNLSLYTVSALLILDTDGQRVLAKYYAPPHHDSTAGAGTGGVAADLGVGAGGPGMPGLTTIKEQKAFEKGLMEKIRRGGGESSVCLSRGSRNLGGCSWGKSDGLNWAERWFCRGISPGSGGVECRAVTRTG